MFHPMIFFAAVAFLLAIIIHKYVLTNAKLPDGCRPLPGPKGLPWLGPVNQLPRLGTWFKFCDWAKEYGPIYSVTLLGKTHVFISSQLVAAQLLASRSAIYSGRPNIATVNDSQSKKGTAEYLPLMSKNKDHTRHKKHNHIGISNASSQSYYNYPAIEAKRFLYLMMHDSTNWTTLTEDMTSRVICRLCWGSPDHFEGLKRDSWNLLIHISPSGFLSNLVAPLMRLPLSINPWKRAEKARHDQQRAWFTQLMLDTKKKMLDGIAGPSYLRSFLESEGKGPISDLYEGAFAVGMLAVTAVYTVSSPMQTFVRAAVLFPSWYRKVQLEVDAVCGHRLPEVSDMENLPTLRAFLQECLRWRPPIPGGIPHELESLAGDIYNGYYITPGAAVHALEYAITHDPAVYPSPDSFNPARWLDPSFPTTYREPLTVHPRIVGFSSFGWGRRYCQGQELTAHELVVACGGLAWAFDLKAGGRLPCEGMEVPKKWDESLIIVRPAQFDVECVVRGEEKREVVLGAYRASMTPEVDVLRGFGAVGVE